MSKRAFVFIDGGNFYFKLKYLTSKLDEKYSLLDFNFKKFAEWLVEDNKLIEIRYYVDVVKRQLDNQKSEKMYADQQRLIRRLQKQDIAVTLGQFNINK